MNLTQEQRNKQIRFSRVDNLHTMLFKTIQRKADEIEAMGKSLSKVDWAYDRGFHNGLVAAISMMETYFKQEFTEDTKSIFPMREEVE